MLARVLAGVSMASAILLSGCSAYMSSTALTPSSVAESSGEPVQVYSLPRGLVQIEAKKADGGRVVTVTPWIVADTKYRFRVDYNGNWFSSDAVKLTTQNGLLQSLWSRTEDRTYDIAVRLARSIGAAQGFLVAPGGAPGGGAPAGAEMDIEPGQICPKIPKEQDFKLIVDPYVSSTWPGWLKIDDDFGRSSESPVAPPALSDASLKRCERGLCTRSHKPWRVRITVDCNLYQDEIVHLPDERDVIAIDLARAPLVDKRFNVLFANGMINEVRLAKPSSAETLAAMPEGILRALASVPAELVQLRFNYDVKRKDLTGAELARLQQEQALRDYLNQSQGKASTNAAREAPVIPQPQAPGPDSKPPTLPPVFPIPDDWDPAKEAEAQDAKRKAGDE